MSRAHNAKAPQLFRVGPSHCGDAFWALALIPRTGNCLLRIFFDTRTPINYYNSPAPPINNNNDNNRPKQQQRTTTPDKMVKPQTARRRQRVQQQQHQHAAQSADEIGGMHDEADIMSFRQAATQRFLLNQELIENLTEKWIQTGKIIKPKPFMHVETTKTAIEEVHDELFFGNLELMKQKLALLEKQVSELTEANDKIPEQFSQQRELIETISTMSESYEKQTPCDTDEISTQFTTKTGKTIIDGPYKIRQIPALRNDSSEAPASYWDDLQKAREQEAQAHIQVTSIQPHAGMMMDTNYTLPDGNAGQDQLGGFDASVFGTTDLDMIDEASFGLQGTLDDQDFLSQMDHSME